jgi:hypothetical protein
MWAPPFPHRIGAISVLTIGKRLTGDGGLVIVRDQDDWHLTERASPGGSNELFFGTARG